MGLADTEIRIDTVELRQILHEVFRTEIASMATSLRRDLGEEFDLILKRSGCHHQENLGTAGRLEDVATAVWAKCGSAPAPQEEPDHRAQAKRPSAKRCSFGVDLNVGVNDEEPSDAVSPVPGSPRKSVSISNMCTVVPGTNSCPLFQLSEDVEEAPQAAVRRPSTLLARPSVQDCSESQKRRLSSLRRRSRRFISDLLDDEDPPMVSQARRSTTAQVSAATAMDTGLRKSQGGMHETKPSLGTARRDQLVAETTPWHSWPVGRSSIKGKPVSDSIAIEAPNDGRKNSKGGTLALSRVIPIDAPVDKPSIVVDDGLEVERSERRERSPDSAHSSTKVVEDEAPSPNSESSEPVEDTIPFEQSRMPSPRITKLACDKALSDLVKSTIFDYCISGLIIINAAAIGFQTDYMLGHISEESPPFFRVVEATFCILFTAELALRIYVHGRRFFFMPDNWKWNLFDSVVVGLELAEELVAATLNTRNTAMPGKLNVVRVLRLLRLVRIIRLVRILRFVQELRTMVCSIANSFRSLCWTVVLLMLMIYIVSVCLTQLVADHGSMHPELFAQEDRLKMHYGSLPRSVLSLFQAITGGLDWNELLSPLMEHISPLMAIVFSLYICFSVLAMMNVITGVFVESALNAAKADKEKNLLSQLYTVFLKTDLDKSGFITWEEFAAQLDEPQMENYFKSLDIDSSEAYGLFTLLDVQDCGEINVEEFVLGCLRLRGPAQAIDLATLTYFNKRMSARWRAHAVKVESLLESILHFIDSALAQESCSMASTASLSSTYVSSSSVADLATWAELKAEGEKRHTSGKTPVTTVRSQSSRTPSTLCRKLWAARPGASVQEGQHAHINDPSAAEKNARERPLDVANASTKSASHVREGPTCSSATSSASLCNSSTCEVVMIEDADTPLTS